MSLKLTFDRDQMYVYPWYISDITATKDIEKIAGKKVRKVFVVIKKDFLRGYYDSSSANAIGLFFFRKILTDRNFFQKVIQKVYNLSNDLIRFCEGMDKIKFDKLTDLELFDLYGVYTTKLRKLRCWGWVPVFLDGLEKSFLSEYILEKLRKHLKKINKEDKIGEYYSILSSSNKKSEVQKEELARFDLLFSISKDNQAKIFFNDLRKNNYQNLDKKYPPISFLLKKHLRAFSWLTYAYSGPPMGIEYLFKILRDDLKRGAIKKQKLKWQNHYDSIQKEKEKLLKNLLLNEELVYLFQVSTELMYLKDYRKGIYQKSYVYMDGVLGEIAKRFGIDLKGLKYLTLQEIKDGLLKKRLRFWRDIAEQRKQKCCYLVENGRIAVFQGGECDKIILKLLNKKQEKRQIQESTEIKGLIAYAGCVRGVARIVLTEKDVEKVKEGDVLVSSSTNPDLILAMKKAIAFVTDLGGITSHAAIISREMKKPCVVGTKEATRVFKDGDLIEVNANAGIVKLIQKVV